MKRSTIILITSFMSLALAGLTVFQVVHVRELLTIRQKQFDANVVESLHETASSLENHEAAQLLGGDMFHVHLDSILSASTLFNDSINLLLKTVKTPRVQIKSSGNGFKYKYSTDSLGMVHIFKFDDGTNKGGWERDFEKNMQDHEAALELKMEELRDRFNKKEQQISITMKKMEKESMFSKQKISTRVDSTRVEKTLTTSLRNRGITIPYSYAVVNSENDSVIFSNDSNAVEKAKASVYSTQLFPNDIIPENNFLTVWFPQKSKFLFTVSDFNLLSSFAFILIVIICFAYTLLTLIKQKKLSDMKSDFINNMTHELKTPIATISVATDALRDTAPTAREEQIKYYSGIIRQENERMNAQVERVLQLAQLDKKEMQLNKESINLHDLIHNAAVTFRMQIEKSKGTLAEELTAENPVFNADPLHISNVIHNLLDNAKKYSPERPDIKIKTRNEAVGIFLSVSDKGIGMNKETQKKIFDKFYRASRGNIHDVKGFGIGLSYVKEITELHGGRITVESQPGEGSTFTIFIPYE